MLTALRLNFIVLSVACAFRAQGYPEGVLTRVLACINVIDRRALCCRCFDLYEWSVKARVSGAVVFSTLQSGTPETGQLSALLDNMTTIYTGSGTLPAASCSDKVRMTSSPLYEILQKKAVRPIVS